MPVFRCLSVGVVLGCLPMTVLGQRQLVQVALPTHQSMVQQLIAPPAEFVELCTTLKTGRMLTWQFEADAPVAFHTHFHVDGDVRAPENMSAITAAQGRLTPKGDNDYCWLWSNRSAVPVAIRMRIGP